jgi:uncharacterized repeat protein (TIGR01451 family)
MIPKKLPFLLFSFLIGLICVANEPLQLLNPNCSLPVYGVTGKDVSGKGRNDGRIRIIGIQNATHYEILKGNAAEFDFKLASPLNGQTTVELRGLTNPDSKTIYRVRLYNGSETCYTDQSVHLSHILYAENLDYTELSVLQGVDNPSPAIGDIVTFTTTISNGGTKVANNVEISQFVSSGLDIIYFYADAGEFSSVTGTWRVGAVAAGRRPKLVVRARVKNDGLAYLTSYLSRINEYYLKYGDPLPTQDSSHPVAATSCITVPIQIKPNEVYKINLQSYAGLKWYYKDAAGNFSEIDQNTNPAIAVINSDSSLSIKRSGEFTYTRTIGKCTYNACCPVIVQSCEGPPIIVDSVYCNTNVDSYNIVVHLKNDNWSLVERVYYALSNISYPVLSNFLGRLNLLPLTSSSGYVTSLGGGYYKVENIPAFIPNVTLVSTDLQGFCRNVRIVNAPNCQLALLPQPQLVSEFEYYTPSQGMPSLRVANPQKKLQTVWYSDELGMKEIGKGKSFRPSETGRYFVAFVDKQRKLKSVIAEAEVKALTEVAPGEFVNLQLCDCKNPSMLPEGTPEEYTLARIFPNPVDEKLHIEYEIPSSAGSADIFVFTVSGRQTGSYALDLNTRELDVTSDSWQEGVYVMTLVVDGKKKVTQRFVVRH